MNPDGGGRDFWLLTVNVSRNRGKTGKISVINDQVFRVNLRRAENGSERRTQAGSPKF